MFIRFVLACSALLPFLPAASAQTPTKAEIQATLTVGMNAPPLSPAKWVKGAPVANFEKGKVYVVEFWATWCGPCIASMPHLSELQHTYAAKGVTVIGMTSLDKLGNDLPAVETMVTAKGDGMGYTVAWDTERQTADAYMKAAGRNGIPCSFLVDQNGKLAYIGHPMNLDVPLRQVVAGTWDIEKGNAMIAEVDGKMKEVYKLMPSDPKAALTKLAEVETKYGELAGHNDSLRFDLLLRAKDFAAAYTLGGKLVDNAIAAKNAAELNAIAWQIVDPDAKLEKRDLDLALRAAEKAVALTNEKDGSILDTLARVHFTKGDVAKAIELQTKAVANSTGEMQKELEKVLAEYKGKNSQ
ncbi:MAG: redoxin family protein [Planctomycetes bacterium]|nr:redoxin family protein [Planctomycetota bacterium]